jgi:hypothetical protein
MYKYLNGLLEKTLELTLKHPRSPTSPTPPATSPLSPEPSSKPSAPLDIPSASIDQYPVADSGPLSSSYYLEKVPTILKKIPSPSFKIPPSPSNRMLTPLILGDHIPTSKEISAYSNSSRITHDYSTKGAFARLTSKPDSSTKVAPTHIPIWLNWTQGGEKVYVTGTFNSKYSSFL